MHTWKAICWAGIAVAAGALAALYLTPADDAATRATPSRDRVESLLDDYRKSRTVEEKGEVLRSLERTGSGGAARTLAQICRDETDAVLREQAAVRLSRIGDKEAAPALVEIAREEKGRGEIATAAVRALGRTRLRQHVPFLMEVLGGSEDTGVREAAARALGSIADPEAVGILGDLLEDPEREVRRAAIRSLGGIHSARSREILEEFLRTNPGTPDRGLLEEAIAEQRGEKRTPLR